MTLCKRCSSERGFTRAIWITPETCLLVDVVTDRDNSRPVDLSEGETCDRCGAEPREEKKPRRIAGVPP